MSRVLDALLALPAVLFGTVIVLVTLAIVTAFGFAEWSLIVALRG